MGAHVSETGAHEDVAADPSPPSPLLRPALSNHLLLALGERFGLLIIVLAVILTFSLKYPGTFATTGNWQTIASSQSVTLVIALAFMIPLCSGNFDLSVGSTAGLAAMVSAGFMSRDGWDLWLACGVTIAMGLVIGVVNGVLVSRFRLGSFIATLGSATILDGLLNWYSNSQSIASGISTGLVKFGTSTVLGIPWLTVVALLMALVVGYVIKQTPLGRRLTSVGSSVTAARLVGIRVDAMVLGCYVVSGGMASVAGILLLAQQGSASPGSSGIATLVPALAAVYLGASTWDAGRINIVGTIIGLLLVGVLVSGLTLAGVAAWVDPVSYGVALILAVGASGWFRRKRTGAG
jgi:ribose transport system permease protein